MILKCLDVWCVYNSYFLIVVCYLVDYQHIVIFVLLNYKMQYTSKFNILSLLSLIVVFLSYWNIYKKSRKVGCMYVCLHYSWNFMPSKNLPWFLKYWLFEKTDTHFIVNYGKRLAGCRLSIPIYLLCSLPAMYVRSWNTAYTFVGLL